MAKIPVRMGDGSLVEMTESEIMKDVEDGVQDAVTKAKVPPLTEDEMKHLCEVYSRRERFVAIEPGKEVVITHDEGTAKLTAGPSGGAGAALDIGRTTALLIYERLFASDTAELAHLDYSFKPIKSILGDEQVAAEEALLATTIPIFYGCMPNLGLYTAPDGPYPNPIDFITEGKLKEARAAAEEMIEAGYKDMVYIASGMTEAGIDCINFDTVGAAGDYDFIAALRAVETLKKEHPEARVEMGMAGEFVLGIHGDLSYAGERVAGMYPLKQLKALEKAGVDIFGPVVRIVTRKSCAWNQARNLAMLKPVCQEATIPIHVEIAMGVGAVPLCTVPPIDAVSRATKSAIEILPSMDGI